MEAYVAREDWNIGINSSDVNVCNDNFSGKETFIACCVECKVIVSAPEM